MSGPKVEAHTDADHDEGKQPNLWSRAICALLGRPNIGARLASYEPEQSPGGKSQRAEGQRQCHARWRTQLWKKADQKDKESHASKHETPPKVAPSRWRQSVRDSELGGSIAHREGAETPNETREAPPNCDSRKPKTPAANLRRYRRLLPRSG